MTTSLILRSARLIDGRLVDIVITDGIVATVAVSPSSHSADVEYDLNDYIVMPSFVEPHAHLDKAFLADRVDNPSGDLMGAIQGLEKAAPTITHDDIVDRATTAAILLSRNGATTIRTHADTTLSNGLNNVAALLEAKEKCASFLDIQVAMLLEWPLTGPGSQERRALAHDAITAGVDVVGGCPHLDDNPREAVEYLLELAVDSNLPLDLHADENLRLDSCDLEHLANLMLSNNVRHAVNASHCVSLSTQSEHDIRRISEKVAAAGITVTALPQTNLFLQSRGVSTAPARAITPISILHDCGVTVAAGGDNLQDPFNLVGRGDPLEIASLLVTAAHLSIEHAVECVSTNAARAVGIKHHEISTGQVANLVGVRATTLRESVAMGPPDRFVVYGGVVIDEQIRNRK